MSRYPPPPSFGVPFNPNGQYAPSQSAPYQNVSTFPFYQPSDPTHQGRAHQPSSFTNNYSFSASSQNMNVPISRPGVPQITYSGFGQMTSGSFPPPPYPSIQSLPYSSFLHPHPPPPPLLQRDTQSASIQTHVGLPLKPPPTTSPTPQGIIKDTLMPTTTMTDLEDGELSDRDGGRGSRRLTDPITSNEPRPLDEREAMSRRAVILGAETNIGSQVTSHVAPDDADHHHLSAGARNQHSPVGDKSRPSEMNTNNETVDSALRDPIVSTPSEVEIRVKDVPPVVPTPVDAVKAGLAGTFRSSYVGIIENQQVTPVPNNLTGHSADSGNRNGNYADISSPYYSQVPRGDLRQRAKAVLKELYPLKIGFLELVKEGIEPKLLTELYAEIGIEIPPSTPHNSGVNGTETNHHGRDLNALDHIKPQPVSMSTSQIMGPQQNRDSASKESILGGHVPESLGTPGEMITGDFHSTINQKRSFPNQITLSQPQVQGEPHTQTLNPTATQASTTFQKTTASASRLTKAPPASILGRPTIAKPGEKALERKDYIARMLAAKAGRPVPALNAVQIMENASNQPQGVNSKPVSPKQVKSDDEDCLLIENLSYRATELDLKVFFSAFPIKKIDIPVNTSTKTSLGYCFVVLLHPSDNPRAINELSGKTLFDHKVSVKSIHMKDVAEFIHRSSNPKADEESQIVALASIISESKPDSKKSAQTELARQKIEALKARENNTKDQSRHAVALNHETSAASATSQAAVVPSEPPKEGSLMHITENNPSSLPLISTSKIATFNIPGLFMEPIAQEVATPNNQTNILNSSGGPRADGHLTFDVPRDTHETTSETLKELPSTSAASDATKQQPTTLMHRKRQKAADFIDSPSFRMRRSLGQAEDTSVIIEVSEDEGNVNSGDDVDMDVDMDIDNDEDARPATPQQQLPNIHNESGKPKSIKDQPPLSDIPTRKPVTPRILRRTPPKVLTPKKNKEPQGLEIEIELMDRKIAEMQQRILAKQNASRAQTPDKLGNHGKIVGISTTTQVHVKPSTSSIEEARISTSQTDLQKPEEDINIVEVVPAAQAALVAEKAAEAAKVIEQERVLSEQHSRALEQARFDAERLRAIEAEKIAEEERRRSRRTEIEAGIPVLDAEMDRATQKLHSLRRQIEELEIEVQKGVEGRRALLEELTGLSSSIPPVNLPQNELNGNANNFTARTEDTRREGSSPSYFTNIANSQQTPDVLGNDEVRAELVPPPFLPQRPFPLIADTVFSAHEQHQNPVDILPAQNELEEFKDVSLASAAAISTTRSLVSSGEDYVPSIIPPTIEASISDNAAENKNHDGLLLEIDSAHTGEGIASRTNHPLVRSVELDMIDNYSGHNDPANIDANETGIGPDHSLPIVDANDSDDYEPPEPALTVEPSIAPSNLPYAIVDEAKSLFSSSTSILEPLPELIEMSPALPVNGERSIITAQSASSEKQTDTNILANPETNHYVPYESPLRKFKSYRYHPEYLNDVPRGFRSLTYSHCIDFNKYLCQYEAAGGTCNDNSCVNQHFRSMGLSDNMILVQMGAIPEGLTHEDGDAYANGLRQIIQEIRSKKVRDFNVVASEITAYRAKFLGEKVKVLPL